jgi:hypothetical protein
MRIDPEGTLAVLASVLVLFTAMLDPAVSAGLAVVILAAGGIWKLARRRSA